MIKDPAVRRYAASEKGRAKKSECNDRYNASENGRAKRKISDRRNQLKRLYGITVEQYNEMLASQGGACATCRRAVKKFHVDHCHLTGLVRGILCPNCNHALGLIHENSGTARALAEYLEKQR